MDMEDIDISPDQIITYWFIDLDWYESNNRSFPALAQRCLCANCRERLKVEEGEVPEDELLAAIKDCCSQEPGFITGERPILESLFRLFLANGNQPLTLEELGEQLSEWRGEDSYRISAEILYRLLKNEQHYGLRQVSS